MASNVVVVTLACLSGVLPSSSTKDVFRENSTNTVSP